MLYRAHYVTRTLEEVFRKRELPYTIYSGAQFFDRKEIKDALSYLRMIAYQDDLSFARIANVPRRNLGEKRMHFLKEYAGQNDCTLYEALQRNLEHELFRSSQGVAVRPPDRGFFRGLCGQAGFRGAQRTAEPKRL